MTASKLCRDSVYRHMIINILYFLQNIAHYERFYGIFIYNRKITQADVLIHYRSSTVIYLLYYIGRYSRCSS